MTTTRKVFFLSDGTGITVQTMGHSLITQFENVRFETINLPYIDTIEKAQQAVLRINQTATNDRQKPIIFATLVDPDIRQIIANSEGQYMDFFQTFLEPLEQELGTKSSRTIGRSHGLTNTISYKNRIDALNYTLGHDDGVNMRGYEQADVILIGVSRCGKTPTCLYLALQFGILAANYPFTDEHLNELRLPEALKKYKAKLFGLTIEAERLQAIRSERRPNSNYAALERCRTEVNAVEAMYRRENITFLNTTRFSIEEISTKIMALLGLERKCF